MPEVAHQILPPYPMMLSPLFFPLSNILTQNQLPLLVSSDFLSPSSFSRKEYAKEADRDGCPTTTNLLSELQLASWRGWPSFHISRVFSQWLLCQGIFHTFCYTPKWMGKLLLGWSNTRTSKAAGGLPGWFCDAPWPVMQFAGILTLGAANGREVKPSSHFALLRKRYTLMGKQTVQLPSQIATVHWIPCRQLLRQHWLGMSKGHKVLLHSNLVFLICSKSL